MEQRGSRAKNHCAAECKTVLKRAVLVLFFENEINRQYQKAHADKMIPPQGFVFEKNEGEKHKNNQYYYFLNHFQLHQ